MGEAKHLTMEEIEASLDEVFQSPKDGGTVALIVRRPETEQREVLEVGELDPVEGLVGDNWSARGSGQTEDGSAHPDMQLNIMNARMIAVLSPDRDRWQWAGDQLFFDLDLSKDNLPAGTRLSLGSAVIEVTAEPHTGCSKFVSRYGADAMKFVNSDVGKQYCLRGINAKVVQAGSVRAGDPVQKQE